ncbi:aldo/keto reductase [Candidatus Poriferisodalis sp.]|uniref:aldo/keto reductase n=1 Tax=Candidatus Poriferisodalis sp. TaxID=3101277 RepID=UPI003B022BCB
MPVSSLVRADARRLGANGPQIGPLALGLWRFTGDDVDRNTALIETALDLGMNLIDIADVYGLDWGGSGFGSCEDNLGALLRARPALRDRMVLATKGGIAPPLPYDSGAAALRSACEASLTRLGTDHVDLYQVHRPDMFTHPAELADTLDGLIADGLAGAVGVSNYTPAQTRALATHLDAPLVSTQPEYSAACLDPLRDGTLDLCAETGMVPLAWSPLAGGRLMAQRPLAGGRLTAQCQHLDEPPAAPSGNDGPDGPVGDPVDKPDGSVRDGLLATLDRLAERESVDRAAVCVAFVLAHPTAPIAIVGTQQPERLVALQAALTVRLDRNDLYDIIEASEGRPLP